MLTHILRCVLTLALLMLTASCSDVSVFLNSPTSRFSGVQSVNLTDEGTLRLEWKASREQTKYKIYLKTSSLPPDGFSLFSAIDNGQENFLPTKKGSIKQISANSDYKMIGEASGSTFDYVEPVDTSLFYSFVVVSESKTVAAKAPVNLLVSKIALGAVTRITTSAEISGGVSRLVWNTVDGALAYEIFTDESSTEPLLSSNLTTLDLPAYLERYPGLCIRARRGQILGACQGLNSSGINALITRVSSNTANGYYAPGAEIYLTVQFSNTVSVSGSPELPLNNGKFARYVSGSGGDSLLFLYNVNSGDDISLLEVRTGEELSLPAGSSIAALGRANIVLPLVSDASTLQGHALLTIDTISPSAPAAPSFLSALSTSAQFDLNWGTSFDANFKKYNVKLCAASDCASTCTLSSGTALTYLVANGSDGTSYYACVQGEDKAGLKSSWVSSLSPVTVDISAPFVSRVQSVTANGYYKAGDVLQLKVIYSEPVFLVGTSNLALSLAGRTAAYLSGSGSNEHLYSYTVQSGDTSQDLDLAGTAALSLSSGSSLRDAAGNDAVSVVPIGANSNSLKTQATLIIDTTAPTIPSGVAFNNTTSGTTSIPFSWTAGSDTNFKQYNTKICATNLCSTGCTSAVASTALTSTATGVDGSTYFACTQMQDQVGQVSAWVSSSGTTTVDLSMAGVLNVQSHTANGMYKAGDVIEVDVTFSKNVTVSVPGDLKLMLSVGGASHYAGYLSGSGTAILRFQYSVVPGDNTSDLNYVDSASLQLGTNGAIVDSGFVAAILTLPNVGSGQALSDNSAVIIDTTAPTAPGAPTFAGAFSTNTAVALNWTESTDDHFLSHNLRLCTQSNCTTGCTAATTSLHSPASVTGVDGTSYYACVQGEDQLAQKSAWVPSASQVKIDVTAPTITSVEVLNAAGRYDVGQVISLAINMSENVNVTFDTSLGLSLEVGSNTAIARYDSGSGTNQLVFKYTVAANDATQHLELKSANALTLGATGTIKDDAGLALTLTAPIMGATSLTGKAARIIDTLAPIAPSSVGFAGTTSTSTSLSVSWSNATDPNFDTHNVKICENIDCSTDCSSVTQSTTSPVSVTGVDGKTYYACVQGQDLLNHRTAYIPSTNNVRVDTTAPTVLDVTSVTLGDLFKFGETVAIRVKFSEVVTVAGGSALALKMGVNGGATSATFVNGSGSDTLLFNYTVANGDESSDLDMFDTASLTVTAPTTLRDAAGNAAVLTLSAIGSTNTLSGHRNIVVDGTKPTDPSTIVFTLPAETINPAREIQWTDSTDTNLLRHNLKLCESSNCSTNCLTSSTSLASPKTLTGTAGKSYYACVQGQDNAGNLSAWVASSTSAVIDASPTFAGISAVDVLGSWTGKNAKVQLTFATAPAGHITHYKVFYSTSSTIGTFDLNAPIATIAKGDATFDSNPADTTLLLSLPVVTLEDGYYLVRYVDQGGYFPDNNSAIIQGLVLKGAAGFKLIPKAFSGLAYDYYMMKYEARLGTGVTPAGDSVTTDETALAKCSARFHVNGTAFDSTCGTKTIVAAAKSEVGVTPKNSITWNAAYNACRNASSSLSKIRMPTHEEWSRASRNLFATYNDNVAFNTPAGPGGCNTNSAASVNTSATACLSELGLSNMVGNLAEWVDYRVVGADVSRYTSTTRIGKLVRNGIDNITMQWPDLNPLSVTLAMVEGSYFDSKPKNHEGTAPLGFFNTTSTGNGIGFRCVGFRADSMPSVSDLALVDQPKYTASDSTEAVSTRRFPENNFVGDDKPERVSIQVTGTQSDALAEGNIDVSWTPWSKTTCDIDGVCSSSSAGLTYKLYRFLDPNFYGAKPSVMRWSVNLTGGAYPTDQLLDPLLIDANWGAVYTAASATGKLIATITNCEPTNLGNCHFNDNGSAGTDFSAGKMYEYVLVVGDGSQNFRYAEVQRHRSVLINGNASAYSTGKSPPMRLEPRFRKAGVFPIDPGYQSFQTNPQYMVHVPMDISGLDRDFFIHKYEAAFVSGTLDGAFGNLPRTPSNPGSCFESVSATNTITPSNCGDGTALPTTDTIAKSAPLTAPFANLRQGDAIFTCMRSQLTDVDGVKYRLHLPSAAEWTKAADWGDVDMDGVIDQNAYTGGATSIAALQATLPADGATYRCHVDGNPASPYSSADANTSNCFSRYGAENMVGNVAEWVLEREGGYVLSDNGVDGISYGRSIPTTNGTIATLTFDMLSALPLTNGATLYADYDAYTAPTTTDARYGLRGGAYDSTYGNPGRFSIHVNSSEYTKNPKLGFRCSY